MSGHHVSAMLIEARRGVRSPGAAVGSCGVALETEPRFSVRRTRGFNN